jgi:hypothetical protein
MREVENRVLVAMIAIASLVLLLASEVVEGETHALDPPILFWTRPEHSLAIHPPWPMAAMREITAPREHDRPFNGSGFGAARLRTRQLSQIGVCAATA